MMLTYEDDRGKRGAINVDDIVWIKPGNPDLHTQVKIRHQDDWITIQGAFDDVLRVLNEEQS